MTTTIQFDNGAQIVLLPTPVKAGTHNTLQVRPKTKKFVSAQWGCTVPSAPLGGKLPKKAVVRTDGTVVGTIDLADDGFTVSGNPRVAGTSTVEVEVPQDDGSSETQSLRVIRISCPSKSTANVAIMTSRPTSAGDLETL